MSENPDDSSARGDDPVNVQTARDQIFSAWASVGVLQGCEPDACHTDPVTKRQTGPKLVQEETGPALKCETNLFDVIIEDESIVFYQYSMTITEKETEQSAARGGRGRGRGSGRGPIRPLRNEAPVSVEIGNKIVEVLKDRHQWPEAIASDGRRSLYSCNAQIHQDNLQQTEVTIGRKSYDVSIQYVSEHPISSIVAAAKGEDCMVDRLCLSALEAALRRQVIKHTKEHGGQPVQGTKTLFLPSLNSEAEEASNSVKVWVGIKQALRVTGGGVKLQVDATCCPFTKQVEATKLVTDFIGTDLDQSTERLLSRPGLNNMLQQAFVGLKVEVRRTQQEQQSSAPVPRTLINLVSDKTLFTARGPGGNRSLIEWLEGEYQGVNVSLNGYLPAIRTGRGFTSPQLLRIKEGQQIKRTSKTLADAIQLKTAVALSNVNRKRKLCDYMQCSGLDGDGLSAWGVKIRPRMTQVEARLLSAPVIEYKNSRYLMPDKCGQWEPRTAKFLKGAELKCFGIVCYARREEVTVQNLRGKPPANDIRGFIVMLMKKLADYGLQVPQIRRLSDMPNVVYAEDQEDSGRNAKALLDKAKQGAEQLFNSPLQLVFVCMRSYSTDLYQRIKQASDGHLSLPSQCFLMRSARLGEGAEHVEHFDNYLHYLCSKINVKLRGENFKLFDPVQPEELPDPVVHRNPTVEVDGRTSGLPFTCKAGPATEHASSSDGAPPAAGNLSQSAVSSAFNSTPAVIGVALSHVSTDDTQIPSFAAMTCNINHSLTRVGNAVEKIAHRQSVLSKETVKSMFKKLMREYKNSTGTKPERVVVYRSGVSEGTYKDVYEHEAQGMIEAWDELNQRSANPQPLKLTYIIVERGSCVRLFMHDNNPDEEFLADQLTQDLRAGLVADKGVCNDMYHECVLTTHAGKSGSSKPCKLNLLLDHTNMGNAGAALTTYWLCHMFQRSCRSGVTPAPLRYAQLLAERFRLMLRTPAQLQAEQEREAGRDGGGGRGRGRGGRTGNRRRLREEPGQAVQPSQSQVYDFSDTMLSTLFYV